MLTGISVTDRSSAEQAARWFLDRGVSIAMITRGAHGVILVGPDGVAEYPAFPATPVDTTAAGDAFSGALGASLARGASLADALRRGTCRWRVGRHGPRSQPKPAHGGGGRSLPARSTLTAAAPVSPATRGWRSATCSAGS